MRQSEGRAPVPASVEKLSAAAVDAAFAIHKTLGPGLLESVYESCFAIELDRRGVAYERQKRVPIVYQGIPIEAPLRLDFLLDDQLIVELKATEQMSALFDAQLLTYLKITRRRLGILINFNVPLLKNGIKRMIL